jgi:energy-coupling factor transport system ATP-binding protein
VGLFLRVKNLSFCYEKARASGSGVPVSSSGQDTLSNISFDICQGEYVAILGENGCGKSTLVSCINGLLQPRSGAVAVFPPQASADAPDFPVAPPSAPVPLDPANEAHLDKIRVLVGMVRQNPDTQIIGSIVEEDAAFGPENLGLGEGEINARVSRALSLVGLQDKREKPPQFLSGGEKQRLAIAGVLALESPCLILDEAASMLDPSSTSSLLTLLDSLVSSGRTVLSITHSLAEAARSQRCLVLREGTLVFDGTPSDLLARPELEDWGLIANEDNEGERFFSNQPPVFPSRFTAIDAAPPASEGLRETPPHGTQSEKDAQTLLRHPHSSPSVQFASVSYEYQTGSPFASSGLQDISFSLPPACSLAIVGRSGCGKTTLLKHINALLLPSAGTVRVMGTDTLTGITEDTQRAGQGQTPALGHAGTDTIGKKTGIRDLRFKAGLAIQSPESALFEAYVADDVAFGPRNAGLRGQTLVKRVKAAMEALGLPFAAFADRETASLSGGEKRRAALAGVFAMDSPILLLDEPTAGLDARNRSRVMAVIREQQARGKTVIVTTHSMEIAAAFDCAAVMEAGRLVAFGPPSEVLGVAWREGQGLPQTVPGTEQQRLSSQAGVRRSQSPLPRRRRKAGGLFRHNLFGQFLDRPSFLRGLGAGKKLLILLLLFCVTVAGNIYISFGALIADLTAGLFLGKVGPKHLLKSIVPSLPFLGILAFFQLMFSWPNDASRVLFQPAVFWGQTNLLGWFSITSAETVRLLSLLSRVLAIMVSLSLYLAATPLRETLRAINKLLAPLSRIGLPARDIAMAVGISLRFVPVLTEEAERIYTAQASRGGKRGIRGTLSLIVPLLLRALERSEALATAMLLRLYKTGK